MDAHSGLVGLGLSLGLQDSRQWRPTALTDAPSLPRAAASAISPNICKEAAVALLAMAGGPSHMQYLLWLLAGWLVPGLTFPGTPPR